MTAAPSSSPDLGSIDLISPEKFAREGYPHAEWTRLRHEAPVYWYERDHCDPFWAITKHADIVEIGKRPNDFVIGPRLAIFPNSVQVDEERTHHLLTMDPPEHGRYRRVVSKRFTPRMVRQWAPRIEAFTKQTLDGLAGEREFDFVAECSAPITIAVIAEMLGLPQEDWKLLFRWTNEIIAPDEPEFQRGRTSEETIDQATTELFEYFEARILQRAGELRRAAELLRGVWTADPDRAEPLERLLECLEASGQEAEAARVRRAARWRASKISPAEGKPTT